MLRFVRLCERLPKPATAFRGAAILALAMATGGCSAGFEMPSLSYNGGPSTNSVPIPREPVYQNRGPQLLGDERPAGGQQYGQPHAQSYSQSYNQPYNSQPYSPPSDGGYERPYTPPYERQAPRQEWRESNRGVPAPQESERGVRVAGLPEPYDRTSHTDVTPRHSPSPAAAPYRSIDPAPVTPPAPPRAAFEPTPTSPAAQADGETIEVRAGDTLYALSKKHNVSVNELMRANNLKGPQLRIGQQLLVPSSGPRTRQVAALPSAPMSEPAPLPSVATPVRERPEPRLPHHDVGPIVPPLVESDPAKPAAVPALPAVATPAPSAPASAGESGWTGTYTVARGDSLFAIARNHNVRLNELERVNKITDPRRVKPGTVLKVPGPGVAAAPAAPSAPLATPPAKSEIAGVPSVEPTIINARTRVAALGPDANAPPPAAAADVPPIPPPGAASEPPVRNAAATPPAAPAPIAKFRWPARGKIIAGFGPQAGGHNEGINIALPRGADVYAAEAGVVTYAGDTVQGYGNLLLVRHDGGWITAYAHNDSLAVKVGEAVRRGQVIAKAGATGSVDTPQLHFEIRQGVKAVDPIQHLER